MRWWQKSFLVVMTASFMSSCAGTWGRIPAGFERDGKYDFSKVHFAGGLDEFSRFIPTIEARGAPVFINKETGEKTVNEYVEVSGHAVIIPPYVLTAAHIVDFRLTQAVLLTPLGPRSHPMYADAVENDTYWLSAADFPDRIPLEKIAIVPEGDWALFKMPNNIVFSYKPLPLGYSAELRVGHVVYLLGSPRMLNTEVRDGVISSLSPRLNEDSAKSSQEMFGHLYGNNLWISSSIAAITGDSGARVVALRDGRLEVIGILNALRFGYIGMIIPIDAILLQIKGKTGIDLRIINDENLKNFDK